MSTSSQLGITVCSECNSRFVVREHHLPFEGKPVRCPRCHREFTLVVQRPSSVEEAALENSGADKSQVRKRRTKAEIRETYLDQVKTGFRALHARLSRIADTKSSEEEVRRWCIDAIRDGLGWSDEDIDTELTALNGRVDIALRHKGNVTLVIECKNTRSKLPHSTRKQAASYAVSLSAEWAVCTNAHTWRLYRIFPMRGQEPHVDLVFDVNLLDEDGVSDDDAELLYLLTHRALTTGDTSDAYHHIASTSDRRLLRALSSERVLRAIRKQLCESYATEISVDPKLTDETVAQRVADLFLPPDL